MPSGIRARLEPRNMYSNHSKPHQWVQRWRTCDVQHSDVRESIPNTMSQQAQVWICNVFESGQAILSGMVQGVEDPTEIWNVYLVYEGLTSDNDHVANGGGSQV